MQKDKIKIGDVFFRLTVTSEPFREGKVWKALTECVCGTSRSVKISSLLSGHTKSCGCYQRERLAEVKGAKIHGLSDSPEYRSLCKMKERCYVENNPAYKYYGGRGIKICNRWLLPKGQGFLNFYEDMGPRPSPEFSIDRIDTNGDYTPENCRWADCDTQANNRRNNKLLTYKGETKTLTQWAKDLNIEAKTLFTRIYDGWPIEKALETKAFTPEIFSLGSKHHTLREWSGILDVPLSALYARLKRGWSVEKTLTMKIKPPLKIEYNGKSLTVKEWCKILKCSRKTLESRIRKGMNPSEAVAEVYRTINK